MMFSKYVCLSTNTWYFRVKKRQRLWLCSLFEIKEVNTFEHKALYIAFLHSIKLSGYKMKIKFAKDVSAVEQRNYLHLNACIVYDLDI